MLSTRLEHRLRNLTSLIIVGFFIGSNPEGNAEQGRHEPPVASSPAAVQPRLRVKDLFGQIKHQIGSNREEISSQWGNPDSVIATTVENPHVPEVIDSVFRLFFEGLEVAVYQSGYDHREFVAWLLVEENHYLGEMVPHIGSPIDSLVAMLGVPDKRDGNTIKYPCVECESGGVEFVAFHARNESVSGIEFNFWIE